MKLTAIAATLQTIVDDGGGDPPPPAGALFDPEYLSVRSLIFPKGNNHDTAIQDSYGRAWSRVGTPEVSSEVLFFGHNTLKCPTGGNYITTAYDLLLDFSSGDFTIEGTYKFPANNGSYLPLVNSGIADVSLASHLQYWIGFHPGLGNKLVANVYVGSTAIQILTTIVADNVQHSFAFQRFGNIFTLYRDGVSVGTSSSSATLNASALCFVKVGGYKELGVNYSHGGYVGLVRFTKGLARYSGSYTPADILDIPAPTPGNVVDSFDINTSANYFQFADTSATWTFGGGNLTVSGGLQAKYLLKNQTFYNGQITVVLSQANDGGIVLRVQSNTTYYLLAIYDASSTSGVSNRLQLYRRIGSVYTSMVIFPITFVRGTVHQVTFRANNTNLQVDWDGTTVINTTDGNIVTAGYFGLRSGSTTTPNIYNSFAYPANLFYSYYRLKVTDTVGVDNLSIAGLQLRSVNGGADIATGGVPSSSSADPSFPVENAFDGLVNTVFKANGVLPQWIKYRFSGAVTIEEIAVKAVPSSYGTLAGTPKDFVLEYSRDDISYSTLITVTGQTTWDYGDLRIYNRAVGTYEPEVPPPPDPEPEPDPVNPWPTRERGSYETTVMAHGAIGNGVHDDTAAFNAALNSVPADGGTVVVPAGTYLIDPLISVKPKSKTLIQGLDGNKLLSKAISDPKYVILLIKDVSEVEIADIVIEGDKYRHLGTDGEGGHGIRTDGATNVTIRGCHTSKCWGDGLIVSGRTAGSSFVVSDSVFLYENTSTDNRRQALTIGFSKNTVVWKCVLTDTQGTAPQAGIDIEPGAGYRTNNILIKECTITGNSGAGINIWGLASNVTITQNTISNNAFGVYANDITGLEVSLNEIYDNGSSGIRLRELSDNTTVYGNVSYRNDKKALRTTEFDLTGYNATVQTDIRVNAGATNVKVLTNHYK